MIWFHLLSVKMNTSSSTNPNKLRNLKKKQRKYSDNPTKYQEVEIEIIQEIQRQLVIKKQNLKKVKKYQERKIRKIELNKLNELDSDTYLKQQYKKNKTINIQNIHNQKIKTQTNRRLKKVFDTFREELRETITKARIHNMLIQLHFEAYIKSQNK